ncbi:hypothetical protein GCM10009678_38910 [Actinomadura kijaniata]
MSSYAVVLRVPHARTTFAAALLGRLSYGIVFLSLTLAVSQATGSYAVAGGRWRCSGWSGRWCRRGGRRWSIGADRGGSCP